MFEIVFAALVEIKLQTFFIKCQYNCQIFCLFFLGGVFYLILLF